MSDPPNRSSPVYDRFAADSTESSGLVLAWWASEQYQEPGNLEILFRHQAPWSIELSLPRPVQPFVCVILFNVIKREPSLPHGARRGGSPG